MSNDPSTPNRGNPLPTDPTTPQTAPGDLSDLSAQDSSPQRRRILIGSQRDPAAYRPKPRRDWVPSGRRESDPQEAAVEQDSGKTPPQEGGVSPASSGQPVAPKTAVEVPRANIAVEPAVATPSVESPVVAAPQAAAVPATASVAQPPASLSMKSEGVVVAKEAAGVDSDTLAKDAPRRDRGRGPRRGEKRGAEAIAIPIAAPKKFPPPNLRDRLSPDLEEELQAAMADVPLDSLMNADGAVTSQATLEAESRHTAKVVAVHRDDVFVELGGREQGILPIRQFGEEMPQPGVALDVVVVRFNADEGLYELRLPNVASSVGDWSQVSEGILVEAKVTGHNAGGLECEVNRIRGFIPISQVALYRVENLADFVNEKFTCLVTDANPERQNLVLSRRAVLERDKEETRKKMFESLAPGQIHEGIVRKIMDFGAFVDLGGVDGLLHISQLGWGRVKHPSEVVQEGQRVRVRIDKIDPTTKKIGLGYRDLMDSPWTEADQKYQVGASAHGRVVKIMEFGAFVELEPGVEGLVHISELSHKRVARVSDVVKEGDEVEVAILSVDPQAQRISLSLKTLAPPPEMEATQAPASDKDEPPPPPAKPKKPTGPLKGGLGRGAGGDCFGLNW